MLRIICKSLVNPPPDHETRTEYITFDVNLPEVEAWIRDVREGSYTQREVVGVEIREGK